MSSRFMPSRRGVALIALAAIAGAVMGARDSTLAGASDVVPQEEAAILRALITEQVNAFRTDEYARAYSFASPGIKRRFPTVEAFMEVIRRDYLPVLRARSFEFGKAQFTHVGPSQEVRFIGPDGQPWTALYTFQKVDADWRISGCFLSKDGVDT